MSFYITTKIVCDLCGKLLGSVELELHHPSSGEFFPLEEDLPEGISTDKNKKNHYCSKCMEKHGERLLPSYKKSEE